MVLKCVGKGISAQHCTDIHIFRHWDSNPGVVPIKVSVLVDHCDIQLALVRLSCCQYKLSSIESGVKNKFLNAQSSPSFVELFFLFY